jgi:hypothetical protein
MVKKTAVIVIAAAVQLLPCYANAQTKVISGERQTVKATVEAVDMTRRSVTVRTEAGALRTVYASADVKRLAEVKPGDVVTATYYDNIVIRKKASGEPDIDTFHQADTPGEGALPSGTSGAQQTITATIEAIDVATPSISLRGPRGWTYASRVQDRKALEQVSVGDRVDITWTEATLVSVAPAKK